MSKRVKQYTMPRNTFSLYRLRYGFVRCKHCREKIKVGQEVVSIQKNRSHRRNQRLYHLECAKVLNIV